MRLEPDTLTMSLFCWISVNNYSNKVLNLSIVKCGQSSPPTCLQVKSAAICESQFRGLRIKDKPGCKQDSDGYKLISRSRCSDGE